MRLTQHEDGWIYGVFCSESKDKDSNDLSAAVAQAGIVRTKDLKTWERLPNLKSKSPQQRNVVLHPEFVDGKYAFYTRPQDDFIQTGSGGGVCFGLCEDINNPVTPANVTSITAKDDGSVYLTLSADAKVGDTYQFTVEKLGDNGYVYVGTFNATVQGNTKAAWVNLSHILSNGTYQVKCGSLTDIHTYT